MEPQITRYLNVCFLWLKEFFSIFDLKNYIPIYGPLKPRVNVGKTPVEFRVSAVLRSKKTQTIHVILFTPGNTKHYVKNDPVAMLAIKTFMPMVKEHKPSNRPQVIAHCFGYGKNDNLNYYTLNSNELKEDRVERLIYAMELGHDFPVIPCLYKCKFKKECF